MPLTRLGSECICHASAVPHFRLDHHAPGLWTNHRYRRDRGLANPEEEGSAPISTAVGGWLVWWKGQQWSSTLSGDGNWRWNGHSWEAVRPANP